MCKERIVNVTCLSQQNLLYPTKLQSSCPHSLGFAQTPKSLGCFKDDKVSRLLPNYYAALKTDNSPENCAYMCLQSGFPYAGVEYSWVLNCFVILWEKICDWFINEFCRHECFCGREEPSKTHQLPDSSCNMKCAGDPKQTCGGYLTTNIFFTGYKSMYPATAIILETKFKIFMHFFFCRVQTTRSKEFQFKKHRR